MKPGVMAAIVVVVLIAIGAFVFVASDETSEETDTSQSTQQSTQSETQNTDQATTNETDQSDTGSALTEAAVAMHNSKEDCWMIINGMVYDVTEFVAKHPGGDSIVTGCGTDATTLFETRTTESGQTVGSGTPHSSRAASQLDDYLLGALVQ